jgi:penicillin-binding protein 1A
MKLKLFYERLNTFIVTNTLFMKNGILHILYRIFGREKVENSIRETSEFINNGKSRFKSNFDQSGRYYQSIIRVYKVAFGSLSFVVIYYFVIQTNFLWLTGSMPSIDDLQNPKLSVASTIVSMDGEIIGNFYAENRIPVDSSEISPWMFKALIATEDARFNEHSGIDLRSLGGVVLGILKGGDRGGGSTISQQLAKNLYNTRRKEMRGLFYHIPGVKTIIYKSKEWFTAVSLERRYTKGEIATMYLNTVDFGSNTFGIKTAARKYFNKEPIDLQPDEAAILVGTLKATTFYNPIRNPENAVRRRNTVLQLMQTHEYLTEAEKEKFKNLPLKLNVAEDKTEGSNENYFKSEIVKLVNEWAKSEDMDVDVYRDGLRIYTTIDARMQDYAVAGLNKHMEMLQKQFNSEWGKENPWRYQNGEEIGGYIDTVAKRTTYYKKLADKYDNNTDSVKKYMNVPMKMKVFSYKGTQNVLMSHMDSIRYYKKFLQSGMVAMDPYNGFIKAWVGGIDFEHFQYDHVKQARRQPGSTFKPILYTAAIDGSSDMSPCDKIRDEPVKTSWIENGEEKTWEPRNANGSFSYANMTLRSALARSVNSVAVQLTLKVGSQAVVDYAKKLGITSPLESVGSIGLGTSDASLYELVAAYAPFVNEGRYTKPMLIYKIEDKNGKVLVEFESETRQVIRPESAFLMQFMLRGNVEEAGGTGRRMFNYGSVFKNNGQLGGKTGTTSNNSDAWYIGFTKDLVCGSWVGGDDRSIHFRSSMGEGSKSALPIVGLFLDKVYSDKQLTYRSGPFLKPTEKIEKDYMGCFSSPSPLDSAAMSKDSLMINSVDSVRLSIPDTNSIRNAIRETFDSKRPKADSIGDFRRRKVEVETEKKKQPPNPNI